MSSWQAIRPAIAKLILIVGSVFSTAACEENLPKPMPPQAHFGPCAPDIFFAKGSVALSEQGKGVLRSFAEGKGCPAWKHLPPEYSFVVRGHTDLSGSPEANMVLSLARAEAVRDYMVSLGISNLIDVVGYGDTEPLVKTTGSEQKNRRARIILRLHGRDKYYF
jgi:outer membrane protein OmpA-like peptidoglycan-associated protein